MANAARPDDGDDGDPRAAGATRRRTWRSVTIDRRPVTVGARYADHE